jgi:septal ring factor EnvC (AmiA/AmiB activator)
MKTKNLFRKFIVSILCISGMANSQTIAFAGHEKIEEDIIQLSDKIQKERQKNEKLRSENELLSGKIKKIERKREHENAELQALEDKIKILEGTLAEAKEKEQAIDAFEQKLKKQKEDIVELKQCIKKETTMILKKDLDEIDKLNKQIDDLTEKRRQEHTSNIYIDCMTYCGCDNVKPIILDAHGLRMGCGSDDVERFITRMLTNLRDIGHDGEAAIITGYRRGYGLQEKIKERTGGYIDRTNRGRVNFHFPLRK